MMNKEKLKKISRNLSANSNDFMSAFRKNMFMYIEEKDITIKEISEEADVPFSTLNTFLYGDSKDIKLSTAVKLAKALNVSIDELVGAGTIPELSRESLSICRNLPDNDLYLVRWYIRYINRLNLNTEPNKRTVSVMETECENGNIKITSNYRKIDITEMDECSRVKVFFGITMPCENYMPHYSPYDILLIANDRPAKRSENILIRTGKYLWIARNEKANDFYSIRDGKYRCSKDDIDEIIGYIADVIR